MNKYTFKWNITPTPPTEYAVTVPPFDLVVAGPKLELKSTAEAADEQRLREQADHVARSLAGSLSCELGERFAVAYQGRHVLRDTGQQSVSASFTIVVKPAPVIGLTPRFVRHPKDASAGSRPPSSVS